jgi:NAD(P)-dependent dehydrogenase (short-subunit alcohol dehydrogenase family)
MLDSMSAINTDYRKQMVEGFFIQLRLSNLIPRFTKPEEITNLVAYVSSPLSNATNGAFFRANGEILGMI